MYSPVEEDSGQRGDVTHAWVFSFLEQRDELDGEVVRSGTVDGCHVGPVGADSLATNL